MNQFGKKLRIDRQILDPQFGRRRGQQRKQQEP